MSFFAPGNTPVNSTLATPVAAPSTATLIAELDSTQLGTATWATGRQTDYRVTFLVGASTTVIWQLEHAASTSLATYLDQAFVITPTGMSGQYMVTWRLSTASRIRVRQFSTGNNACAYISAEPLV